MDPTELLKLLGIVIVVAGFALKLDSILIIMVAAVATALVGGMDPVAFLDTLGTSFVSNRSMCIFIMTFVITGTLERNGLRQAAAALIQKLKNASAGLIVSAYGVVRVAFAAFNVNFGGVAGFIRPVVMPMEQAAVERDGKKISDVHLEELKGISAGIDNVAWFFGQVLFVGGSGGLLVQGTLAGLGYDVSLVDLAAVQVPVAVLAMLVAIVYYNLIDRRLMRRRARIIKATGGSVYEGVPGDAAQAEKDVSAVDEATGAATTAAAAANATAAATATVATTAAAEPTSGAPAEKGGEDA